MTFEAKIEFKAPWRAVTDPTEVDSFSGQLNREISAGHVLHGAAFSVLGRADNSDDILIECDDGTYAIVHLTWGSGSGGAAFPVTIFLDSVTEVNAVIVEEARQFEQGSRGD